MSGSESNEGDLVYDLTLAIGELLDGEPSELVRASALAEVLKAHAFMFGGTPAAAAQRIALVAEVASEQLVEDWDELSALKRRAAN